MRRKSIADYPEDWSEIAQKCKAEASWRCVRCGAPHAPEIGYALTVHHLDINPSHNDWYNLAALCQRCHLHIQGKVFMEQPYMFEHSAWFRPYAAGYYAAQNGHPTDKAWVMENIEMLLDYGRPQTQEAQP